jgi:hypothetical protein
MTSFKTKCFIPLALSVIGFGFNLQSASALGSSEVSIASTGSELQSETIKNFDIKYNTLFSLIPRPDLGENIFRATITGESTDAAFGLTKFESNTYGKLVKATETTQEFQFNANPSAFALKDLPILGDRYFGGSSGELFGTADDSAKIDFQAGTVSGGGTITLTGGTGIFNNASGQITFTQQDKLDPTVPPGTPVKGEAILKFTVNAQKVPEPTTTAAVASIGTIGAGSLLRRKRKATSA